MRLDKFLKVSRIIKRRTVAKQAAAEGRIKVNEKIAKPSLKIEIGDKIEINFEHRRILCEVTNLSPKFYNKDGMMYTLLEEEFR